MAVQRLAGARDLFACPSNKLDSQGNDVFMIKVQVRPNENLEAALRRFKRQCNFAGIFRLAKRATVYEKPSEKRRREDRERVRNIQRSVRKVAQVKAKKRKVKKFRAGEKPGEKSRKDDELSAISAVTPVVPAASATTTE